MMFIATDEQIAISEAIRGLTENVGVDAGAGTGKSTTAKWIVREHIPASVSVLFCVFNKKNKLELEEYTKSLGRRNVAAKTFNGMGFSAMMKALGVNADRIDLDDDKYRRLAEEYIDSTTLVSDEQDTDEDKRQERDDAIKLLDSLIQFFMVNTTFEKSGGGALKVYLGLDAQGQPILAPHSAYDLTIIERLQIRYDLPRLLHKQNTDLVHRAVAKLIEKGETLMEDRSRFWVSFTEQVYWTVVKGWRVWASQLVIVDEAQDLSPLERALVDMHVYWRGNGHVMFIGDPQQAIYAFKGADSDGFANSMAFWHVEKAYPLSLSRRCPKNIAKLVQDHKPGYRVTDDAPDGVIEVIDEQKMLDMILAGDAAISRVRSPMIALWRKLTAAGKAATIVGRDIASSLIATLKTVAKRKDFKFADLDTHLMDYQLKRVERMKKAKKSEQDLENFLDQMSAVRGAVEAVPDAKDFDDLVAGIRAIFKKDDNGDDKEKILIMTGHGSKGLEFKRVFNITPDKFPMRFFNQSDAQYIQELNLDYVQKTRAIECYYYVTNDKELRKDIQNDLDLALKQPQLPTFAEAMIEQVQELVDRGLAQEITLVLPLDEIAAQVEHIVSVKPAGDKISSVQCPFGERHQLDFEYRMYCANLGKLTDKQLARMAAVRSGLGLYVPVTEMAMA